MKSKNYLVLTGIALAMCTSIYARPTKPSEETILRQAQGVFDCQANTAGTVESMFSNNGISWLNVNRNEASGRWPRGSANNYMFGSGIWFGAKKEVNGTQMNLVEIGYNPNSGRSWMVPGTMNDTSSVRAALVEYGDPIVKEEMMKKYRTYFSTDMNLQTGEATNPIDGPNWPLWIKDKSYKYLYNAYGSEFVSDPDMRNTTDNPLGPLFVSDEDVVSIYNDGNLDYYEGGHVQRKAAGYPLGLEIVQSVYSWSSLNSLTITYTVKNVSNTTLKECWLGNIADIDIALSTNANAGATNDNIGYYQTDTTLNLIYAWTDTTHGETLDKKFGYIGVSLLETPAVDNQGNLRKDKKIFPLSQQLGVVSQTDWPIHNDPSSDDARYSFLSSGKKNNASKGDVRGMLATGPFNMAPGEEVRFTVGYYFAMPAKGGVADGTYEDVTGLKVKTAKTLSNAVKGSLISNVESVRDMYYAAVISSGINDYKDNSISIYPNPTNSVISLNTETMAGKYFEIYSLRGEKVQSGIFMQELNVAGLESGVYFMSIKGKSFVFVKK